MPRHSAAWRAVAAAVALVVGCAVRRASAITTQLNPHYLPCGTTWMEAFRDSRTLTVKQSTLAAHPRLVELYPPPDVPITVFAVSDKAYVNVAASFQAGAGMPALQSLEAQMPTGKVASMWLFRSLPQAYDLQGLRGVPTAPTGLAVATGDKTYALNFAPVSVGGANTALVDDLLADVQATPIVNITRVCNSYLFTVDQYLWPSSQFSIGSVPDPVKGGKYNATQNATQFVPDADEIFTPAVRAAMPVPYAGRAGRIAGAVVGSIVGAAALAAAAALAWRHSLHRAARDAEAAGREKGLEQGLAEASSRLGSGGSKHNPNGLLNGSASAAGARIDGAALASLLTATLSTYASQNASGIPGGSTLGTGSGDPELTAALGSTDWQLDPARVSIVADEAGTPVRLGEGGFGAVYLAELDGATRVAVKLVGSQAPREAARFAREVALLKSLRHPNIVQFQGAYLAGDRIALVLEYAARGDLHRALGRDFQREYCWHKRGRAVALDVARAIVYMHSRSPPVVHLDLKPANVLLDRAHSAKVSDVGLSKVLSRADTQVSMEGTFDWAAPELLAGDRVSEKADIYSYGVILWELCTGEPPRNRQMRPVRVPDECPAEVATLIDACRAKDPAQRPSAKDVYERLRATPGPAAAAPRVSASVGTPSSPAVRDREGSARGSVVPVSSFGTAAASMGAPSSGRRTCVAGASPDSLIGGDAGGGLLGAPSGLAAAPSGLAPTESGYGTDVSLSLDGGGGGDAVAAPPSVFSGGPATATPAQPRAPPTSGGGGSDTVPMPIPSSTRTTPGAKLPRSAFSGD